MTNYPALRNLFFRFRWLFRGAPVSIDGISFRLDESLRRLKVNTEPELREAFRKSLQKGDTVIDIGANLGLHSLYIAQIVGPEGRIYAFEPIPSNIRLLQRNIRLNAFENQVTVVDAALSNSDDQYIEMSAPSDGVAVAAAINKNGKSGEQVIKVRNLHLDDYVMEKKLHPRLIKIDVEGAEHEVLKGAEKTLLQHRPILVVEVHTFALPEFGSSPEAMCNYLTSLGYIQHQIAETRGIAGDYYHAVFVPKETAWS
jgi:FkbM family methyltransferase